MSEEKNAIALPASKPQAGGLVWSSNGFELLQRVAKMFSQSNLIPEHLRGNIPNIVIALDTAHRTGENPLMVMQNMYVLKGKPGWSAQYMVARANNSGILRSRINYEAKGSGDSLSVTAYATLASTGERIESTVSMEIAKKEGWAKNDKYRTMPENMLRKRAATWLIRDFMPEVMMGFSTEDELEDIGFAESKPVPNTAKSSLGLDEEPEAVEAEIVEEEPPL